jgi:hypothetical protein
MEHAMRDPEALAVVIPIIADKSIVGASSVFLLIVDDCGIACTMRAASQNDQEARDHAFSVEYPTSMSTEKVELFEMAGKVYQKYSDKPPN